MLQDYATSFTAPESVFENKRKWFCDEGFSVPTASIPSKPRPSGRGSPIIHHRGAEDTEQDKEEKI